MNIIISRQLENRLITFSIDKQGIKLRISQTIPILLKAVV